MPNASVTYPEDPYGPDELLENAPRLWPETTTLPFHYRHPVTGKEFVPTPGARSPTRKRGTAREATGAGECGKHRAKHASVRHNVRL